MSDKVRLDTITGQVHTIRLYGRLGAKFGRVHRMAVASAAEAVRALASQYRGFDAYMTQAKDRGEGYAVFYGKKSLRQDQLHSPSHEDDIRFAPILLGSKNGGWANIIMGAIIIVVSIVIDWATMGAFGAATGYSTYIMGATMILGGIVQLLTPIPKGKGAKDKPENQPSYTFNGPLNTQAQGHPVPVLYGELIVGSAVLSAGISAVDQVYIPTSGASGGGGSGSGGGGGGGSAPWHLEFNAV